MKKVLLILCSILGFSSCSFSENKKESMIDNSTVKVFDLNRFVGKWYEIARYEHRFEKGMTHVSATYTLLDNGKIEVFNQGIKDGEKKEIKGKAKLPDPSDPGKLKVSFFLWFYSDYYVMEVDDDYQYMLIGSSSDKYLWIMSREKFMDDKLKEELLAKLKSRGYDTGRLVFVEQGE